MKSLQAGMLVTTSMNYILRRRVMVTRATSLSNKLQNITACFMMNKTHSLDYTTFALIHTPCQCPKLELHDMPRLNGFSLLELIIVIIIISIVTGIGYISYPGRAAFDVIAMKNQITQDIRYTQILSMSLGGGYSIVFSAASYQIKKPDGTNFTHPSMTTNPITLPSSVTLSTVPQTILFDVNGRPSTGTTLTITTSLGQAVLQLQSQTGFVNG